LANVDLSLRKLSGWHLMGLSKGQKGGNLVKSSFHELVIQIL